MNPKDERNEKTEDMKKEDFCDNEGNDNADRLAQKKRNNEFNATDNTAQFQVFIQNLDTLNTYIPSADTVNLESPENISYNLCNLDECIKFVEKYKDGEYLAIAIILSTFEAVSLGDLPDLKLKLMEILPRMEAIDSEGTENHISQKNPYLSLNTIMTVIGGKRFIIKDGQQYVGLGENSKQALFNIWEQFPAMHTYITSWLIHINEIYEYHTNFDAYQIATAFARVISLDFNDAKKRIFPQLYSTSDNIGLLGILAYKLYENIELKDEINDILMKWTKSDSTWRWKSACLTYLYFLDNNNYFGLESALNRAIRKRLTSFSKNDLRFVAMLVSRSKQFRIMITNIFSITYDSAETRNQRTNIASIYINLVRYNYYLVNSTFVELPLVSCDTKEQQCTLAPIISHVMSVYHLRKQLYVILDAYLKELSNYQFHEKVIKHISAYFFNMASTGQGYQKDCMNFLKQCRNKVATQIYNQLSYLYNLRIGDYLNE